MIDNTLKVKAPIGLNEMADFLVEEPYVQDVCKSTRVNMWAKHKPVSFPDLHFNGTDLSHNYVQNWIGDDRLNPYGIVRPISDEGFIPELLQPLRYKKPFGGMSSVYRLEDFNGYDHKCIVPYSVKMITGDVYENNTHMLCHLFKKTPLVELHEGNLTFDEIFPNAFFCVAVSDDHQIYYKSAEGNDSGIDISTCPLFVKNKTLSIHALLSSKIIREWTLDVDTIRLYGIGVSDNPLVESDGVTISSVINVKPPLENSFTAICVFSDGSHILIEEKRYSTTLNNGVINSVCVYVDPDKITNSYELSKVTIRATNKLTDIVYTKDTGVEFTDIVVGHLDIIERPSSPGSPTKVNLQCSHYAIAEGIADYVYTFHFTKI